MKKIICLCWLWLGLMTLVPAAGDPLLYLDFSDLKKDGTILNRGTAGSWTGRAQGNCKLLPGGVLQLDGLTGRVCVEGSENFDVSRNATFSILYRRQNLETNDRINRHCDGLFSKHGSFIMTRYGNHFYGNVRYRNKWAATCQIFETFRSTDMNWHHLVMSLEYFFNKNEGEEWIEFTFYIDGVQVGKQRFKNVRIPQTGRKLEIGSNSAMGPAWMLGGQIAQPRVYDRILTLAEIRELTVAQKLAKPGFPMEKKLSPQDRKMIAELKAPDAVKRALRNLAVMETENVDWKKAAAQPGQCLTVMTGQESDLVLVHTDHFVHICSWYDRRAGRELLRGNNALLEWTLTDGKNQEVLNPLHGRCRSSLVRRPVLTRAGEWQFEIAYETVEKPEMRGQALFEFNGRRLEFRHQAETLTSPVRLFQVVCPKFSFRSFDEKEDYLVIPYGCGILHRQPAKNNIHYSQPYPRAFNTMQTVAYYDRKGGLIWTTEDPRGRQKQTTAVCSKGQISGEFAWRAPYDSPDRPNRFDPQCAVSAELFRGSWYDAGLVYRRILADIRAPWFRPELPNTDCPERFRNNCIWLGTTYLGEFDGTIPELRRYFGQTLFLGDIWKWWEPHPFMSPILRSAPEWLEWVRVHRKHGIYCQPYIDGRLWGKPDRRGEDYLFSKVGHKINVVSDGVPVRETYDQNTYDVLCPATKEYQEYFFDCIRTLTMQGLDGLYIDQLGACYQPPCHQAKEHGHRYADWDAWYLDGYARLIRRLRLHWREHGTDKVLSTEDNSEMLVGLIDGLEVYRWMSDNQIPMFPLIYSGRTQFYNRHARTLDARRQTIAEQLVNSEQMGILGVGELASPFNEQFRRYVKRLAWTRKAMLEFFNGGMMARPGVFSEKLPEHRRFWGDFGTKYMTKPQVQASVWKKDGMYAAVLVNTEPESCSSSYAFEVAPGRYEVAVYNSHSEKVKRFKARKGRVVCPVELPPLASMIITAAPKTEKCRAMRQRLEQAFAVVRLAGTEEDPFGVNHLPDTDPVDIRTPMHLLDCRIITGARKNRTLDRIDYVSYAMLYPGVMDFGGRPASELELEVACGTPQGGTIRIYADGITPEHLIAEFVLTADFETKHWNDFIPLRTALKKPLTGLHKVVFSVNGLGFVNLKHWRIR